MVHTALAGLSLEWKNAIALEELVPKPVVVHGKTFPAQAEFDHRLDQAKPAVSAL